MNNRICIFFIIALIAITSACNKVPQPKGKLFIIGGGARPDSMIISLMQLSGVDTGGYIVVLPMSSEEPDSAFFYAQKQFEVKGAKKIYNFDFKLNAMPSESRLDSLKKANLIYICGGDQNKFMAVVRNTPIHSAIREAFMRGATIAGTSAGAAVMSKKMITGNEFKHKEYTGTYQSIEAQNIEIKDGLGLVDKFIVDQHFVKRMRMNRLIAVAIENPDETCIGIDEATAILVQNQQITVYGISQIVVLRNPNRVKRTANGLLGATGLDLSVYLPGEKFEIR